MGTQADWESLWNTRSLKCQVFPSQAASRRLSEQSEKFLFWQSRKFLLG